jgi:MFS family permease
MQLAGNDTVLASQINSGAVAAFSMGRLIAAPLFGAICDRLPFRTVFIVMGAIAGAGHLLYIVSEAHGGLALLVAARFMVRALN